MKIMNTLIASLTIAIAGAGTYVMTASDIDLVMTQAIHSRDAVSLHSLDTGLFMAQMKGYDAGTKDAYTVAQELRDLHYITIKGEFPANMSLVDGEFIQK